MRKGGAHGRGCADRSRHRPAARARDPWHRAARCGGAAMTTPDADRLFAGAMPELYERHLVPLIFDPYAQDLAARVAALAPGQVLEVAAGTGVVTRRLAVMLPPES